MTESGPSNPTPGVPAPPAPPAPPDLVPRSAAFDLSAYDLPAPDPFLLDLRLDGVTVSELVPHVSNLEFLRWLDRAAELHADALGCARAWLLEHGRMWFVARHEIDYRAEVWPDDDLLIATWIEDVQRVRSWRGYAVVRPRDAAVVCRARTLWVLVDLESRRPARIPADLAQRFARIATRSEGACTSP